MTRVGTQRHRKKKKSCISASGDTRGNLKTLA